MRGLLYKELVQNRNLLISAVLAEVSVSTVMILPLILGGDSDIISELVLYLGMMIYLAMFAILAMLTASLFGADENKRWAYFISSTPATAAGQVRIKYLCTFIMYTLLLGYSFALSKIAAALGGEVPFGIAFELYFLMLFLHAVEFPFIVRFGSKSGDMVKAAVSQLIMLIVIEYALFGDISSFLDDGDAAFELLLRLDKAGVIGGAASVLLTVFPFFALSMYLFSCEISVRLYLKGVEDN